MKHTIGRLRRQVIRSAAISGLVLASATTGVLVPGAANAADAPLGTYTASLDFADKFVQVGSAHTFDVTFTNTSGTTNYLLEKATASLSGFAVSSATASNGWSASVSDSTVTIQPGLLVNGLLDAQSVTVSITLTAPATGIGNHTFATTAAGVVGLSGALTDFDREGAAPATVIVGDYAVVDTCNAGEACDTGYDGDPSHTEARAVSNASPTPDVVGLVINDDEGGCTGKLKPEGKSKAVTVDSIAKDRTVTVTIQLDKSKVNEAAPNGVGQIVICHESDKPFVDASGNTVLAGYLPVCPSATAAGPCTYATTKTGAGDFLATIRQPGGDPKNVMGYPVPLT